MDYWVGNEGDLSHIVPEVAKQARIEKHKNIKALCEYAISRAYAYKGRALRIPVGMPPPPVDLIARAFRETKGGKIKVEHTADQSGINPLWSAIRSSLSTVKAAIARAQSTALEYLLGLDAKFHGIDDFRSSVAFFLDAELLRNSFFHSIVILNARLWHLNEDQLKEINSARLYIKILMMDNPTSILLAIALLSSTFIQ